MARNWYIFYNGGPWIYEYVTNGAGATQFALLGLLPLYRGCLQKYMNTKQMGQEPHSSLYLDCILYIEAVCRKIWIRNKWGRSHSSLYLDCFLYIETVCRNIWIRNKWGRSHQSAVLGLLPLYRNCLQKYMNTEQMGQEQHSLLYLDCFLYIL